MCWSRRYRWDLQCKIILPNSRNLQICMRSDSRKQEFFLKPRYKGSVYATNYRYWMRKIILFPQLYDKIRSERRISENASIAVVDSSKKVLNQAMNVGKVQSCMQTHEGCIVSTIDNHFWAFIDNGLLHVIDNVLKETSVAGFDLVLIEEESKNGGSRFYKICDITEYTCYSLLQRVFEERKRLNSQIFGTIIIVYIDVSLFVGNFLSHRSWKSFKKCDYLLIAFYLHSLRTGHAFFAP